MKNNNFILRLAALFMLVNVHTTVAADAGIDKPAQHFDMQTLDDQHISLEDLKGNVVVLNFWATWCGPCKRELPLLDAYYKVMQKNGLRVFAVTTEDSLPLYRLKPLAKVLTIPMVRHFHGHYGPLGGVPTNFIIDRMGVLRYAKAAALDVDDMNSILVPLLNEPSELAKQMPTAAQLP